MENIPTLALSLDTKCLNRGGGVFQYVEVVIITLQTKPNHHVDSSRDAEACYVLMHACY